MKKWLKITMISVASLVVIIGLFVAVMLYKIKNGLPFFDKKAPTIESAEFKDFAVLVFSKTNGYRHGEAIEAAAEMFEELGERNDWTVYQTENGAVFNEKQLALFDVVVWSNVTGQVLKKEQRTAFQQYIENGGGYVGIHGAGDFSHPWEWYNENLIGVGFSHHTMHPGLQETTVTLECDSTFATCKDLAPNMNRIDEWYVFYDNPRDKGFKVLYTIDETPLNMSGNLGILQKGKDWGMGDDHPIAWYKCIGAGRTFYSAMGHTGSAYEEPDHITLLQNAVLWSSGLVGSCE